MTPVQHFQGDVQARMDRVSFSEAISKNEFSPSSSTQLLQRRRVSRAALPCTLFWSANTSTPIVFSYRLLWAHEVMVALNALSACAAVTQRLLFPTQSHRSCLKCKALQKSCESRMPSLHRAAQRESLLSSRLPTARAVPSCLH